MKYSSTFLFLSLFVFASFIALPGCCKASEDCADESCSTGKADNSNACVCLTIESQKAGVDQNGNDVWCDSCVVYCLPCDVVEQAKNKQQPCGTAACPAVSNMSLEKCPLCEDCKKIIMKWADWWKKCEHCGKKDEPCQDCVKKMHQCKVKDLTCKESLKANAACKKCPKILKKSGLVKQLQQTCNSKNVRVSQGDDGLVWILLTDEEEFPVMGDPAAQPDTAAVKELQSSLNQPVPPSIEAATTPSASQPAASSTTGKENTAKSSSNQGSAAAK